MLEINAVICYLYNCDTELQIMVIVKSDAFFFYIYSLGVCKLKNLSTEIQHFHQ